MLGGECRHRHPRPRMRPPAHQIEPLGFRSGRWAREGRHHAVRGSPVKGSVLARKHLCKILAHRQRVGRWARFEVQPVTREVI